jgi:hypothetical protein
MDASTALFPSKRHASFASRRRAERSPDAKLLIQMGFVF